MYLQEGFDPFYRRWDAISLQTIARKYYEIEVHVQEVEDQNIAFSVMQRNPIPDFMNTTKKEKLRDVLYVGRNLLR